MKLKLILTTTLIGVFIAGCSKKADVIQVKGSDTLVNAAENIAEEFMKVYPNLSVAVTGGGSGVGIASLINKTCDAAAASREISSKEMAMAKQRGVLPKEFIVAHDGIAVIVNINNPVDKLTIEDLHKIFTGKAVNWKEFGGKNIPIVTLSREVSSGTYAYFKEQVIQLGNKDSTEEFAAKTLLLSSSQAIVEEVVTNESAIGYLGMGYISDRTKSLLIGKNGQFSAPAAENVIRKIYPLSRPLYFYTNNEPQGATKLFIDFALSPEGQRQFRKTGFVPAGEDFVQENQ